MRDDEQAEGRILRKVIGDSGSLTWRQVFRYLRALECYGDHSYNAVTIDMVIYYMERDLIKREVEAE